MTGRLKFWGWGLEKDVLGAEDIQRHGARLREALRARRSTASCPRRRPRRSQLRKPRVVVPGGLSDVCSTDHFERLLHSYGQSFYDSARVFARDFSNPPDVIAFPRSETDVVSVLDWCDSVNAVVIPWGGGSSVVGGVEPPRTDRPVVTLDLKRSHEASRSNSKGADRAAPRLR